MKGQRTILGSILMPIALSTLLWTCAPGPSGSPAAVEARPPGLALHPDNPHYFFFRGEPTVLITSGEHYGAVLNLDFDYRKYLATLAAEGLNLTRVFSGAYVEPQGAFNIERNTLAPAAGRFLPPWVRSSKPGYTGGGNKFDLETFSDEYFARLHDFMAEASRLGIVVEMNLFCPFYGEEQWQLSPMNTQNNVNGFGSLDRTDVYTLDRSGPLLPVQKTLVAKVVRELNGYENLYYEICNEPYFGGVALEWQYAIAEEIVRLEEQLPIRHLISRNVANAGVDDLLAGMGKVWEEHPAVSILNFHYSNPPLVVGLNHGLERVIGENETGFRGTEDEYYRREAWEFILAGGALFNHLDYSFAVGFEDGTFEYPATQPGGGSGALRAQLGMLKDFIEGFDFIRMHPDNTVVRGGLPRGARVHSLVEKGRQYAVYLRETSVPSTAPPTLELRIGPGRYECSWFNPLTGETVNGSSLQAEQATVQLTAPGFPGEWALRIKVE